MKGELNVELRSPNSLLVSFICGSWFLKELFELFIRFLVLFLLLFFFVKSNLLTFKCFHIIDFILVMDAFDHFLLGSSVLSQKRIICSNK